MVFCVVKQTPLVVPHSITYIPILESDNSWNVMHTNQTGILHPVTLKERQYNSFYMKKQKIVSYAWQRPSACSDPLHPTLASWLALAQSHHDLIPELIAPLDSSYTRRGGRRGRREREREGVSAEGATGEGGETGRDCPKDRQTDRQTAFMSSATPC